MEEGEPQHAYAGRRGPDGPLPQAALGPKLGDPRRRFDFQPSDSSIETGTQRLGDGISGACVSGCFCGAV